MITKMEERVSCSCCGEIKTNRNYRKSRDTVCKACTAQKHHLWYEENKARISAKYFAKRYGETRIGRWYRQVTTNIKEFMKYFFKDKVETSIACSARPTKKYGRKAKRNISTCNCASKISDVKRSRGRPRKYDYPATLTCCVTGKIIKTNPTQFKKQLEKSGKDLETFIKTYVCRSAKKIITIDLKD